MIDWVLLPRLAACRDAPGEALVEPEQLRGADIVRSVTDRRLDFGMVRDDAVTAGMPRWKLGKIGYPR